MSTNSNKFLTTMKEYFLNCANLEAYNIDSSKMTEVEIFHKLQEIFANEYSHEIRRKGTQTAFAEWLSGLPTVLIIAFENYKIIELAKQWGSLEDNSTEREENKILANYFNFMACKFFQVAGKVNKGKI